jgi:hypothetical protein
MLPHLYKAGFCPTVHSVAADAVQMPRQTLHYLVCMYHLTRSCALCTMHFASYAVQHGSDCVVQALLVYQVHVAHCHISVVNNGGNYL